MNKDTNADSLHSDESESLNNRTTTLHFGGFYYDEKLKCLRSSAGEERRLRAQSLAVFQELARFSGQVVSKNHLTETVWPNVQVTDDSIGKCVSDIRKALSDTEHVVLQTIPRQGYMLVQDELLPASALEAAYNDKRRRAPHLWMTLAAATVVIGALLSMLWNPISGSGELNTTRLDGVPKIQITGELGETTAGDALINEVLPELRLSLSRYRTLILTDSDDTDYTLKVSSADGERLSIEFSDSSSSLIHAQSYEKTDHPSPVAQMAQRAAASIASPGVGVIDRELLETSRLKPIETLTHAECFAHGFGCSKCSGEEDNITQRAEACLAHMLDTDPENYRAWALQATIHAHQYWWGNTLPEPLRSHLKLRKHLPDKAIEAANKAEALSPSNDSAVYWGLTEAYYSSCQTDKMAASIERGLEINPHDPNLLAAFGNWLSYSGRWDEGAAMTQKALDIEPQFYRKWWWMGLAKTHYFKEEFQHAYDDFLKSFNERNWISHLQFAYTLPHLDRIEEAQHAVQKLQDLAPQMTIERALEHYEILCFPDSFLENMKIALERAGLPSRGNSETLSDIILPRASIIEINGYKAEYLDHGDGEPILFVHGTLSDYRSWGYYLVPISERHRFISYSRRYFGTQNWQDDGEHFKSAVHASDLIAFIEALDIGPVHVVSWSTGFIPAQHAILQRADLFKSAVHYEPVDIAIFNGQSLDEKQMEDWNQRWEAGDKLYEKGDLESETKRFVETVFQTPLGSGFDDERESLKEVFRQNARTLPLEHGEPEETRFTLNCDKVSQTTIPTLIVQGEESHYFYSKQAELVAQCIPGSSFVTLPGVNHRGAIDAVLSMTDIIAEFVAQH